MAPGIHVLPPIVGRAPLRRGRNRPDGNYATRAPADSRRAPLRRLLHDRDDRPMTRLAAGQRRAPLRLGEPSATGPPNSSCAPARPPAGSIAASHAHGHQADADACSRRSTAGSIAASKVLLTEGSGVPAITGGLHCGCQPPEGASRPGRAPAVRRRAPLRPAPGNDDAIRRQCSRRSAAAPLRLSARWLFMSGGAPAVRRRAPLRLEQVRHRAADRLVVFPLFTGGLHCGTRSRNSPCATATVLPPLRGGLHCGERL